jgi:nucleoside-diphosphate-sugar epimerase
MSSAAHGLTVAVTGPTGTFGSGLIPVLEADDRVERIVGVARRPFDPAARGWTKLTYRQGDVRDPAMLEEAFAGADVVVHLAFLITGSPKDPATRAVNVEGTVNTFKAAAAAGVKRFVYASSASAYGFAPDTPIGIPEDWPSTPAQHFFYAQEKYELETTLQQLAADHPDLQLYVLRPPGVFGPDMMGAKSKLGARLMPWFVRFVGRLRRFPIKLPVPMPRFQMQVIHADDVGRAFLQCIVGGGPPGAYNIAGDGVVESADLARVFGLHPISFGDGGFYRTMGRVAASSRRRFVPDIAAMMEFFSIPVVLDTTKAKEQLGWSPQWTGVDTMIDSFTPHGPSRAKAN